MTHKRYAVLGTGALGGFYGACLAKAGLDVHFLMRSDADHARQKGISVNSCSHGEFTLNPVHVYTDPEQLPDCDVALLCFKTTSNHMLGDILPKAIRKNTTCLVLQNGLGVEDQAAQHIDPDRILGGLCFLCSNKVAPATIHHLGYGDIRLGRYRADGSPAGIDPLMKDIASDFQHAGITMNLLEDLLLARWQKLIWNVPYNGLSTLLNATTDRLMAHPHTRALVQDLMHEVAAAASDAAGRTIEHSFIQEMLDRTDRMASYRPSMLVDRDENRPLEIASIFEAPLAAARQAGTPTPRLEMLTAQLALLASL